jgi:hypothetical protein
MQAKQNIGAEPTLPLSACNSTLTTWKGECTMKTVFAFIALGGILATPVAAQPIRRDLPAAHQTHQSGRVHVYGADVPVGRWEGDYTVNRDFELGSNRD